MASGIVSIAAAEDGFPWLSRSLGLVTLGLYVTLAARALGARPRAVGDDAFAAVAATSVVGTRVALAGHHVVALAFAAAASALWVAIWVARPRPAPATGTRLLATVATESVAIVSVVSAAALEPVALAFVPLGVALYLHRIVRLDPRELRNGGGDIWVTMGALAISALAAADLARRVGGEAPRVATLALWAAASCWIPLLVVAELRWPRPRFEPTRWATVFPLGMYATACAAAARAGGPLALDDVSRVFLAAAVTVWALVAAGALRRLRSRPGHRARAPGGEPRP